MIAAIILAAGASTRLGQPKQLAQLGGETLLDRTIRTATEAGCDPVLVLLGEAHQEILSATDLRGAVAIVNDEWTEGMASSIRVGIGALIATAKDAEGVILTTCDQPAVTSVHLRALMASGQLAVSNYAGRSGVPAYFPAAYFAPLLDLRGDTGARTLLQEAASIPLARGELDIDTTADLDQARRLFGVG